MALRLTLIPVPAGNDARAPLFPGRDRLDLPFEGLAESVRRRLAEADRIIHAPEIVLGSGGAEAAAALSEVDYGGWTGRAMADVATGDPEAFEVWRTDMAAAPHGGESLLAVRARVGRWLATIEGRQGHLTALCSPVVARIALTAALDAPLTMIWRLDPMPWAMIELTFHRGRWALRLG